MAKSIKDLREEKGYRSAREFAEALGIAASSMSRYDRDPETIPMKHAIAMADLLECSVDEIVGRTPVTSGRNELQEVYDTFKELAASFDYDSVLFVSEDLQDKQPPPEAKEHYEAVCRAAKKPDWEPLQKLLTTQE